MASPTSTADIDVQIAFDDGAVLQGLSSVHRVDDGRRADLITQAIAGSAKHSVYSKSREDKKNVS